MDESYLGARLEALRRWQNADRGWGYFPGKQSWIEPTAWATLALHGEPAADGAWTLLQSWQRDDGSWRPSADVQAPNWASALCITIACVRGEFDDSFRRGVAWMLGTAGSESVLWKRALLSTGLFPSDRNVNYKGWPWKPDGASSVEPTAHTLVALQKAADHYEAAELADRVRLGRAQLFDVRCADSGWNYGHRGEPSYPETTGLALLGLQGAADVAKSIELAKRMAVRAPSAQARAWLRIALAVHGEAAPELSGPPTSDILLTAVEALGCSHYKFLRTGGRA